MPEIQKFIFGYLVVAGVIGFLQALVFHGSIRRVMAWLFRTPLWNSFRQQSPRMAGWYERTMVSESWRVFVGCFSLVMLIAGVIGFTKM